MSGCVEHATISQEALRDASQNHSSICFAWVDRRNAFGSVRHICLYSSACRGTTFRLTSVDWFSTTTNSYTDAKVSVGKEMTPTFPFALGVFQGCVLSPVLFNICFQPLLNSLHHRATSNGWSYSFKSNPSVLSNTSAYADGLEICLWSVTCCQAQLDLTNSYLLWSRSLQARPDKCFAAALGFDKAGHFGPINPNLSIGGTKVNDLGDADFKYLGKYLRQDPPPPPPPNNINTAHRGRFQVNVNPIGDSK